MNICQGRDRCICTGKYLWVGIGCIAVGQLARLCGDREGGTT